MKKILLGLVALMVAASTASAGDTGMDNILGYMGDAIALGMFIVIFLVVASWVYLPLGAAFLAHGHYKKKGETGAQEDNTLKMAAVSMVGGLIGMIASYIIVGTFGSYAGDKTSLRDGNVYMIKALIKPVQDRMAGKVSGK